MEQFDIYKDIAERTNGCVYLGIVGPVRTGKSTFIKRFMDLLVLPNIENNYARERAQDELPQSASGKNIMTTEPKFVPNEAVAITIGDDVNLKVRMIDCVGYIVPEAEGHMEEENTPRMVHTPWAQEPMPFLDAAELGTKKVITDHSTIGIVITTDGSVTDLSRESYQDAEQRVINELKQIGKPFVVLLNTSRPYSDDTMTLQQELSEKYGVPILPVNCAQLKTEDIKNILEKVLYEFPMKEIRLHFPTWIETLEENHWLKQSIITSLKDLMNVVEKLTDVKENLNALEQNEYPI